jgi:hypothetical protein
VDARTAPSKPPNLRLLTLPASEPPFDIAYPYPACLKTLLIKN